MLVRPGPWISAALLAVATPAGAQSIVSGTYDVAGTDVDGSTYTDWMRITAKSDTDCVIDWERDGKPMRTLCLISGDALATSFLFDNAIILLVYRSVGYGRLEGIWKIDGEASAGRETITLRLE